MVNVGAAPSGDASDIVQGTTIGDRGMSLSVVGQVDELIRAAMDHHNLAQMYVGWMPWL